MTTDFDYPDAPPLGDEDFRTPGVPSPDATAIAIALNNVARAIDRLAQGRPAAPSGPPVAQGAPLPPVNPAGPPVTSNETQVKRGKAIYAKCMNQTPPANVKQIGEHVVGHTLNGNSQKWDEADQVLVLDAMKGWGWS